MVSAAFRSCALTAIILLSLLLSPFPALGDQATAGPAPQGAPYRYIWTARDHSAFTPGDLALLGNGFSTIIIEKSYDGGDFAAADAAVRQLTAASGHPRVLVNYLTTIITAPFLRQFGAAFDDAWILRDATGTKLPFKEDQGTGWYVDLSNPAYRHFIEQQVASRLAHAPYAGVMFDNFHPTADDVVAAQISPGKAAQLDAALPLLISETKALLGPGKLVYVNGVARGTANGKVRADRGFAATAGASGVQDEFFCYLDRANTFRSATDTWADITTYRHLAEGGQTVLHSVKIRDQDSQAQAAQIKRFCFGAFLMDLVPGHSLIQFKEYASEDGGPQIEDDGTPEQALALGAPAADPTAAGPVWSRSFQHGWVAVNAGVAATTVTVPADLVLRSGSGAGQRVPKGSKVTIAVHDAAYFTTA